MILSSRLATAAAAAAALLLHPQQISATGQESLEELEELEVIFGGVSELGGLERCTSLRSLTRKCLLYR